MADMFKMYVACCNDAFENGNRDIELARILRELADKLETQGASGFYETVRDQNGNDVGRFAVKSEAEFN